MSSGNKENDFLSWFFSVRLYRTLNTYDWFGKTLWKRSLRRFAKYKNAKKSGSFEKARIKLPDVEPF